METAKAEAGHPGAEGCEARRAPVAPRDRAETSREPREVGGRRCTTARDAYERREAAAPGVKRTVERTTRAQFRRMWLSTEGGRLSFGTSACCLLSAVGCGVSRKCATRRRSHTGVRRRHRTRVTPRRLRRSAWQFGGADACRCITTRLEDSKTRAHDCSAFGGDAGARCVVATTPRRGWASGYGNRQ